MVMDTCITMSALLSVSLSCRTGSFSLSLCVLLVRVRVLLSPPMTTPTSYSFSLRIVESIFNLIGRTSLAGRTSYTRIRHYLIDRYYYNVSIVRNTATTNLCIRTDQNNLIR